MTNKQCQIEIVFAIVLTHDMFIQSLKYYLKLYFGAKYGKGEPGLVNMEALFSSA